MKTPLPIPNRTADVLRRRRENAFGRFFIDDECIICGACWRLVPEIILSHEVHTFAYFFRQPNTTRETEACREALRICPVGAIGESGNP